MELIVLSLFISFLIYFILPQLSWFLYINTNIKNKKLRMCLAKFGIRGWETITKTNQENKED